VSIVPAGNLAFIAGQVSANAGRRDDEFSLQFAEVFEAIGSILTDLGADFDAVAEFTTYLVDPGHVPLFRRLRNALFPTLFHGDGYPPNTLLVVQRLGEPEWLIEVRTVVRLPD
jgi:enamine deaminase RidA (YjgF/YER057c/UK114 family)